MDNLFTNLIDESQRLHDINENMLIAKNRKLGNKNANKSALKYDHCGKKGYKKDRCQKLHPNLAPNKNKENKLSPENAQKTNSKELTVLDILFILYKDESYNNMIIPSMVTISELALSIKYLSEFWILDLSATSYIYYDINLFDYIAPTLSKIIQGNALTLPICRIRAITMRLLNAARVVLKLVLYILELQLNLVSLSYLI